MTTQEAIQIIEIDAMIQLLLLQQKETGRDLPILDEINILKFEKMKIYENSKQRPTAIQFRSAC